MLRTPIIYGRKKVKMKIVLEKDNNLTVSINEDLQGSEIAYALKNLMYQLLQRFPDSNMEFAESIMEAFASSGQKNVLYLDKKGNEDVFSCFANGSNIPPAIATLESLPYLDEQVLKEVVNLLENGKTQGEKQPHEETHHH